METITENYRRANAGTDVVPREYRGLTVTPFQDALVGDVRLNLLLLFSATSLLLLIACANLATLLLTRFAARGKACARDHLGDPLTILVAMLVGVGHSALSCAGLSAALHADVYKGVGGRHKAGRR